MSGVLKAICAVAAALALAGAATADTLELKDGTVLRGRYLGGTAALVRFEVRGRVQTYQVTQIVALTFTSDYGRDEGAPAEPPPPQQAAPEAPQPPPSPGPAPAAAAAQSGDYVTIPAGTPLLVRMIDSVDSSRNRVGDIFQANLESDLVVNDMVVARRGSNVYGELAEAKQAGHFSGSSELQLQLTRIVIDGREYPVVSSDYNVQGKGRGANTAEKVGGGAIAGAIIGAIAGGGKGAAIGAGAGAAAGTGVQILTRGQKVRVPSETLLEFRLEQPVSVQAAARDGR